MDFQLSTCWLTEAMIPMKFFAKRRVKE